METICSRRAYEKPGYMADEIGGLAQGPCVMGMCLVDSAGLLGEKTAGCHAIGLGMFPRRPR
jgi:hypothetical protein